MWLEKRLQARANTTDYGEQRGPFNGEQLTGADVCWLASRSFVDDMDDVVDTNFVLVVVV